jgi:hypothetical protein
MFPIKGIREHISSKLNEIGVLRQLSEETLIIEETSVNERRLLPLDLPLLKITLQNIPAMDIWVYENEFYQISSENAIIDSQKGAFASAGSKVEKSIIYYQNNTFYILMIEMKKSLFPKQFSVLINKFTQSLNTLSIYLASNPKFTNLVDANIYPIGICCYNYDVDCLNNNLNLYQIEQSEEQQKFKQKYIDENLREFTANLEPVALNNMLIPIVFCQNNNVDTRQNPITTEFEINFNDILTRALAI